MGCEAEKPASGEVAGVRERLSEVTAHQDRKVREHSKQ